MGLYDSIKRSLFAKDLANYKKTISLNIQEAREDSRDDYLWSSNSMGRNQYTVDDGKLNQISRRAQFLYESDGLAKMIINRIVTYVFEKGFSLDLKFEDSVPEDVKSRLNKAVYEDFWDSEEIDLMNRVERLIRESAITGEHGWKIKLYSDGTIRLGDFCRDEVENVITSDFDSSKIIAVLLMGKNNLYASKESETERLKMVVDTEFDPFSDMYKHLTGDVFFYRLNGRTSYSRGVSDLQQIVDEIADKKRFWRLSQDKILNMLSIFLEVMVKGADENKLREMRKLYGEYKPKDGEVRYVNENIEHKWVLPDIKSLDVTEHFKTMLGSVLGAFGMPLSWYSFGDEANYATAKAQGNPFFSDMEKRQKTIINLLTSVTKFVIDRQVKVGNVPKNLSNGKLLRDSVIVKVNTISLTADTDKGRPNATKAAADMAGVLAVFQQESGIEVFSPSDFVSLFNQSMAIDGIDITLEVPQYDDTKGNADTPPANVGSQTISPAKLVDQNPPSNIPLSTPNN